MIKRADWLAIGKDRAAISLLFVMAVLMIAIIAMTLLRIHVSDIQLPVRFTGYGESNIYRDQWYTHFSYLGFALVVGAINGFLFVKTYQINRTLSLGLLGLSIFTLVLALIILNAIFTLTPAL